jgi:ATP-dependent Lon protease
MRKIPIVAIRGSVVFPYSDTLLSFGRNKSVTAVNASFQSDRMVAVFAQKDSKLESPKKEDLYTVGTLVNVSQMMSTDNEVHALVRGRQRVTLLEIEKEDPYLLGNIEELVQEKVDSPEISALANRLSDLFKKAINLGKSAEIITVMRLVSEVVDPVELTDQIASVVDAKFEEKQEILETMDLKMRMVKTLELLAREVNVLEIEKNITKKTQKKFDDQMRRATLKEKKKEIEKQLGEVGEGEGDVSSEDIKEYKKKIKDAKMPTDVLEKAEKELKKLASMSSYNPESGYVRNYLDWLCDMPWSEVSPNNVSIKNAAKILEKRHYGLKKAKERILEYLSVMQMLSHQKKSKDNNESQPTILCFIGPPGVGKTSIGKAIAESLNRKFVRISLGGIRDEAEIRGHRRTYVGALPGRIIQGIKNAGTKNPVFMLDEIDKIGADFRGDPSSALLETLDPEQNREFSDHYLEVPFDLSQVMFITTGNVLEDIPAALRDRMEVIRFAGYTEDERFFIAKKFLWPKQLRVHGLTDVEIEMTDEAIKEVVGKYTREAGVRSLERALATVCRKIARLVAEKKKYPKKLNVAYIHKFLGPQRYTTNLAEKKDEVGMSTGLAVTSAGGEILFIEVSLMPGRGRLTLTGQLGDVMKESAQAAFTWVRAHHKMLGIKANFASKNDVHIHVPEGAVPKDGPSAGTAITTALVSAVTGIPTKRTVGMTGEITLRGRVTEIGGVKEKTIAGHRAGLKTIILPKENKKDMEDVPKNVQKDVKFLFAERIEDVLSAALSRPL